MWPRLYIILIKILIWIEIYNTVCDMNKNKYQIESIVNIISDWKFENNSVYDDSEQTTQNQNKYCSKHCYNVNEVKKLDFKLTQLAQWALQENIKFNALSFNNFKKK